MLSLSIVSDRERVYVESGRVCKIIGTIGLDIEALGKGRQINSPAGL
ncbi:MAG: hypothetical protein HC942_23825 [Microcoleus sp. SU_5_6]|nr:hypothetical protein [Microcoleus sp. SU_5_6]